MHGAARKLEDAEDDYNDEQEDASAAAHTPLSIWDMCFPLALAISKAALDKTNNGYSSCERMAHF
jgi:hypothetical protein